MPNNAPAIAPQMAKLTLIASMIAFVYSYFARAALGVLTDDLQV